MPFEPTELTNLILAAFWEWPWKRRAEEPRPPEPPPAPAPPPVRWYPPGSACEIKGIPVAGGMVYVGSGLASVSPFGPDVEPALVDPRLRVHLPADSAVPILLPYWPSYSEISPEGRGAYLRWLAEGRSNPQASIGLVFLFFYGLERRLLHDANTPGAVPPEERDRLLEEIERLLEIYGGQGSFHGYASRLLAVVRVRDGLRAKVRPPEFPPSAVGLELPLELHARIGAYVALREAIPADWALAWAAASPETRLRTPALRAPELFRELYHLRYREMFLEEGGLVVKAPPRPLRVAIHPASASFRGATLTLEDDEVRDVSGLTAAKRPLLELLESVTDELAPFSRATAPGSEWPRTAALALLPAEIGRHETTPERERLRQVVRASLADQAIAILPAAELRACWTPLKPGRWTAKDDSLLIQLLAQDGLGVEPDPRFEGVSLEDASTAVLFRFHEGEEPEPSNVFRLASLLVHLGALVARADDEITGAEKEALVGHLEQVLDLGPPERVRLRAHLAWNLAEPSRGSGGLKYRLNLLDDAQRRALGSQLVVVAGADGRISKAETRVLRRVFKLLGLAPSVLDEELRSLGATTSPDEPVARTLAGEKPSAYAIDRPAEVDRAPEPALVLDPQLLAAKFAEAQRASDLLAAVFTDEEEDAAPPLPDEEPAPGPSVDTDAVLGLDSVSSALLLHLSQKATWPREDLLRVADRLGTLLDGALEAINAAGIERLGAPIAEGDDPIEIDVEGVRELLFTSASN